MAWKLVDGLVLRVMPSDRLSRDHERRIVQLFARSYRRADVAYLRESLRRLRHVALAFEGEEIVGFSLAESRRLDLPRLPGQIVRLAGLACVGRRFRRRRLMSRMNGLAFAVEFGDQPGLFCGRMAHPATYRMMSALRGVVPQLGVCPTVWQQDVARAIADAYGVASFDPETFVCRGRGRPIGWPVIEIDATPEHWALFAPVDRGRGDSLLGMAWLGDPPPGW